MTVPIYFFFAILGCVAGGAVVWLFIARNPFETTEEPWLPPDPLEAGFLADEMTKRGRPMDEETAAELIQLHLDYVEGRARQNLDDAKDERIAAEREAHEDEHAEEIAELARRDVS